MRSSPQSNLIVTGIKGLGELPVSVCTAVRTAAPTHALTLTEWIDHCVKEVEERGGPCQLSGPQTSAGCMKDMAPATSTPHQVQGPHRSTASFSTVEAEGP